MSGFTSSYINFLHEVYGHNTNTNNFAISVVVTLIYKQAVRVLGKHCKFNDRYCLSFDTYYTQ